MFSVPLILEYTIPINSNYLFPLFELLSSYPELTKENSLKELSLSEKADQNVLQEKLSFIFSLYDKGVKKNVIKQNKAARNKSNLSTKLVSLSA